MTPTLLLSKYCVKSLRLTLPLLYSALEFLYKITNKSGKILFVGTKKQASTLVEEFAKKTEQFYIYKKMVWWDFN